jgi:hypothetical protein
MRNTTQPRRILLQIAAVATGLVTFVPIIAGLVYALSPRNWTIPTAGFTACYKGCQCVGPWIGYYCEEGTCVDALTREVCGCISHSILSGGCVECTGFCGY